MYIYNNYFIYVYILYIYIYTDFTELRAHYHTILHLMPVEYEMTVGKLQDYISDDQICAILSSNNLSIANKIMLDCLIERMKCRDDLLILCDLLESISTATEFKSIINDIRAG